MNLQSLQDAIQGELGGLSSKTGLEKPPSAKEFFPTVLAYCKSAVPQITISRSQKFKNAVLECFKQHYKVKYT